MKDCNLYSDDELLLFAYREIEDPEMQEHLDNCPQCRAYVEDIQRLSKKVQEAAVHCPSDMKIMQVRKQAANKRGKTRGPERGPRLSVWLAAAALAALVVSAVVYWRSGTPRPGGPGNTHENGPVTLSYLFGVDDELAELESEIGSMSVVGGAEENPGEVADGLTATDSWETVTEGSALQGISEMELAVAELEYNMGLGEDAYYDSGQGYYADQGSYEIDVPLLPGVEAGKTL